MEPEPLAVLLLIYDDPAENDRLALIGSTSADHNNCGARHSQNGDTAASGATNTTGDATGARGETGGG